jgi:hypothetical protein
VISLASVLLGGVFIAVAYGAWRMASWESKLITDWLDGDRKTPPPNSAFFPQEIARQWWDDYERGGRQ